MTQEQELRLSRYKEAGDLDEAHGVKLVRNTESGELFVRKTMRVYDLRVYRYLADHPMEGIPRIEELIEDGGVLYVIEEYIPGKTLRHILDIRGPLPTEVVRGLTEQLLCILRPLHRLNPPIVHRDIKPGNLIVTRDGRLFLVDFNAAKETRKGQTRDTVLIGTAGYAAPEQYGFSASGPAADIYAVGVLMNEMLTGCLPDQKRYRGVLEPVVRTCLQIDSANRYRTVDALLKALKRCPSEPDGKLARKIQPWLLPGFRSRRLAVIVPALLWYLLGAYLSLGMGVEGRSGASLYVARGMMLTAFLLETMWLGNYRGVWNFMPLTRSGASVVRIAGAALWGMIFFVFSVILTAVIA